MQTRDTRRLMQVGSGESWTLKENGGMDWPHIKHSRRGTSFLQACGTDMCGPSKKRGFPGEFFCKGIGLRTSKSAKNIYKYTMFRFGTTPFILVFLEKLPPHGIGNRGVHKLGNVVVLAIFERLASAQCCRLAGKAPGRPFKWETKTWM